MDRLATNGKPIWLGDLEVDVATATTLKVQAVDSEGVAVGGIKTFTAYGASITDPSAFANGAKLSEPVTSTMYIFNTDANGYFEATVTAAETYNIVSPNGLLYVALTIA